jgi:8-amino-7-oxononanoate synthase
VPARALLPAPLRVVDGTWVVVADRKLSIFAGCDYLGLSAHPALAQALTTAALAEGVSARAGRKTTGNHPLLVELEAALAEFFDAPTATVLSWGYAATLAAAQALAGDFTHAFVDEKAHHAVQDAAIFLGPGTRRQKFRHGDADDLARRLRRLGARARPLVLTDGVFAYDGGIAPLPAYLDALPRRGMLLVDDAHGAGVLGANGRGTPEHWQLGPKARARLVHVFTLSKAFGAGGGVVLGPPALRRALAQKSRVFGGSTSLSLPLAAAARAALPEARDPARRERLRANVAHVRAALRDSGLPAGVPSPSPIVAIFPKTAAEAEALRTRLDLAGIFPSFIHYAGGPASGYFRLAVSSEHTPQQVSALAAVLAGFFG